MMRATLVRVLVKRALGAARAHRHAIAPLGAVDAFVACGGNSDKTGHVHRDTLVRIIKKDFGLTIDIEVRGGVLGHRLRGLNAACRSCFDRWTRTTRARLVRTRGLPHQSLTARWPHPSV